MKGGIDVFDGIRNMTIAYFVYCKDCNDYTKWDTFEEADNQKFKHYWKQHESMDNIIVTKWMKIDE